MAKIIVMSKEDAERTIKEMMSSYDIEQKMINVVDHLFGRFFHRLINISGGAILMGLFFAGLYAVFFFFSLFLSGLIPEPVFIRAQLSISFGIGALIGIFIGKDM